MSELWTVLSGPIPPEQVDEDAFKRDLMDARLVHQRTGQPVEAPGCGLHNGVWVYSEGQRERFFEYPPRVVVLLARRGRYHGESLR